MMLSKIKIIFKIKFNFKIKSIFKTKIKIILMIAMMINNNIIRKY